MLTPPVEFASTHIRTSMDNSKAHDNFPTKHLLHAWAVGNDQDRIRWKIDSMSFFTANSTLSKLINVEKRLTYPIVNDKSGWTWII